MKILYLNGLNNGTINPLEKRSIASLAGTGLEVEHVPVNWLSDEPFDAFLERFTGITRNSLLKHGCVALVGASAGGSLALNIFGHLANSDLYAITLCSRLHEPSLPWWEPRTPQRMSHIGKRKEARNFYSSVQFCEQVTLPKLTDTEKQRIITIKQWADEVVPRPTMNVEGLREYRVPALGHVLGIAIGIRHLPEIIEGMNI